MSDARTLSENKTYYMKEGDRYPILSLVLYNEDGTIKDLTEADVGNGGAKLVVTSDVGGRRLVDEGNMALSATPTDGTVTYSWAARELVPGEYKMEVIVKVDSTQFTGLDNSPILNESFPKDRYYKLVVLPHL